MNQLQSENTQLEFNPTKNQAELDSKKQQLKDLETKSKELIKSLPIDTQISILQKEIQTLTNKPAKTKVEEALLDSKRKELDELLKKQSNSNTNSDKPSDRIALYIGLGITVILLVLVIFIIARVRKKRTT